MRFTYRELLLLDDMIARYATVLEDEGDFLEDMPSPLARAARRDWQRRQRLYQSVHRKLTDQLRHRQSRMTPEQMQRQSLF
ncbi:hypothetical protein [Sulfobacillus thermosulfidooxidans]|uniref:hypothetical protein n=1 Tax=Sulfobacillus thermosulfidooxidans TaxID=28034 RepID=UPI0002F749A1|nr:hypothetical protein [Sulfobacillus thermosulfidooxidans]